MSENKRVVPEGWKLVPAAMTPEMMAPLRYYLRDKWFLQGHSLAVNEFWASALAAAPPPPANIGADSPSVREKALRQALEEAVLQIEYLHGKFAETGSGNAVLGRARAALATPAEGISDA